MGFYGVYGPREQLVELEAIKITKTDLPLIKDWVNFANEHRPVNLIGSELCNFLAWDIAVANVENLEGVIFKVISKLHNVEKIEGILFVRINNKNEVYIEGLEVAPWNRESYLQNEREFRLLGLILIGQAILYGNQMGSCGIIRLESLDVRRNYYKSLEMDEESHGEFVYSKEKAEEFIEHLIELGLLQVKEA